MRSKSLLLMVLATLTLLTVLGPIFAQQLTIEAGPAYKDQTLTITVKSGGNPVEGAFVQSILNNGTPISAETDTNGQTVYKPRTIGTLTIVARHGGQEVSITIPVTEKPAPRGGGGGGGGGGQPLRTEVLLVANSIDSALASDFLSYLDSNNIDVTLVNATEFTEAARVENRLIIILGGPDAYEGIGEIVSEVLSDAEEAAVRSSGAQEMFVKYNVWTSRYSYNQKVIIIAGSDRGNTQAAESAHDEDVKSKVFS